MAVHDGAKRWQPADGSRTRAKKAAQAARFKVTLFLAGVLRNRYLPAPDVWPKFVEHPFSAAPKSQIANLNSQLRPTVASLSEHVITAGDASFTWYATMSPNDSEPRNAVPLRLGDLVDEREAATILGVSRQTLANWRWKNEGPRVRRVGARLVRYHRADLLSFINGGEAA